MKTKAVSRLFGALFVLAAAVLIITFSIGLPIYFRPFYYLQIESLGLPQATGHSYEEIKAAYDEVLDFLVLPGGEFSSGVFAFSEEGASHFADCKALFTLNAVAFIISLVVVVALILLDKKRALILPRPSHLPLYSWTGIGVLSTFVLLAAVVATDFERAFVIFHGIFFSGKDNWIFDPRKDEIIRAMPEEFFMACAILIVCSIIVLCLASIIVGVFRRRVSRR